MAIVTLGKTLADQTNTGSPDEGVSGYRLTFPSVENATLVNIMLRSNVNSGGLSVRAALYSGGTTTNPTNAVLIEDFGTITWDSTTRHRRYTSVTNPALTAGTIYWILFKTGTVSGIRTIFGGTTTPDFVSGYRYGMTNINTDPAIPWETPLSSSVTSTNGSATGLGISLTYQIPDNPNPSILRLDQGSRISITKNSTNKVSFAGYKDRFTAQGGEERIVVRDGIKYKEHLFKTSDTLIVNTGGTVNYAIVAGGGGGGSRVNAGGGGGGAGGMLTGSLVLGRGRYTAVIAAGGAGASNSAANRGSTGGQSSLTEQFSFGGGGGGASNTTGTTVSGSDGGSGGGVGGNTGGGTGGAGTAGQGNDGGGKTTFTNLTGGGGGGGRMAVGGTSSGGQNPGGGGDGMEYPVGSGEYYAGGGGGGGAGSIRKPGGIGGGGAGGLRVASGEVDGENGETNTGGGGGGGAGNLNPGGNGGNGGSGIIILQYLC